MSTSVDHRHELVVIGASAGGVQALQRVVAGLPADLPASVCVVLHRASGSPSLLAEVLDRAGPLPCRMAVDGEELVPGRIIVAPPDHHLTIEDGSVKLTAGPREHGHRPAIDALFRTAAAAYDGRVIGVVLSGALSDGSAGLSVIKGVGGGTIVQDPEQAMYPGMPASAIASTEVDAVVELDRVAEMVVAMVNGTSRPSETDLLADGDADPAES